MTVFAVQDDGRYDLSDARRYGEVKVMFRKDVYADNANEKMPSILKHAYEQLKDFVPNRDFVCLIGAPLYTAVCLYVLGDLAKAPVRLLRYDRIEAAYYPVTIG